MQDFSLHIPESKKRIPLLSERLISLSLKPKHELCSCAFLFQGTLAVPEVKVLSMISVQVADLIGYSKAALMSSWYNCYPRFIY